MDYEYRTIAEAQKALEDAIADTVADNPEVGEDDIAHDMTVAIALMSSPDVATELCQRELGFVPSHLQMIGHVRS